MGRKLNAQTQPKSDYVDAVYKLITTFFTYLFMIMHLFIFCCQDSGDSAPAAEEALVLAAAAAPLPGRGQGGAALRAAAASLHARHHRPAAGGDPTPRRLRRAAPGCGVFCSFLALYSAELIHLQRTRA